MSMHKKSVCFQDGKKELKVGTNWKKQKFPIFWNRNQSRIKGNLFDLEQIIDIFEVGGVIEHSRWKKIDGEDTYRELPCTKAK